MLSCTEGPIHSLDGDWQPNALQNSISLSALSFKDTSQVFGLDRWQKRRNLALTYLLIPPHGASDSPRIWRASSAESFLLDMYN